MATADILPPRFKGFTCKASGSEVNNSEATRTDSKVHNTAATDDYDDREFNDELYRDVVGDEAEKASEKLCRIHSSSEDRNPKECLTGLTIGIYNPDSSDEVDVVHLIIPGHIREAQDFRSKEGCIPLVHGVKVSLYSQELREQVQNEDDQSNKLLPLRVSFSTNLSSPIQPILSLDVARYETEKIQIIHTVKEDEMAWKISTKYEQGWNLVYEFKDTQQKDEVRIISETTNFSN